MSWLNYVMLFPRNLKQVQSDELNHSTEEVY